jgi:hypothetical protein
MTEENRDVSNEAQGPALELLTRRLAETPEIFLDEPRIGSSGRVHVAAVVQDLLASLGSPAHPDRLAPFTGFDAGQDRNRLAIDLILCWLLADGWFRQARIGGDEALKLLGEGAAELARQVASRKFVTDPDRREELARLTLSRLGHRPRGETEAQSQDRLMALSSTERARVVRASREAEERSRSIREALRRKSAQESADKWTRE